MPFEVGTRVTYLSPHGAIAGSVRAVSGEHVQVAFDDGKTAWVQRVSLTPDGSAAPFPGAAPGSQVPSSQVASAEPVVYSEAGARAPSAGDTPLGRGQIALVYLGLTALPLSCSLVAPVLAYWPYFRLRQSAPERAKQWQRHTLIASALGFVLWFGISLVGFASYGVMRYREAATRPQAFTDGMCEVSATGKWHRQDPPQSEAASLELQNTVDDLFLVLVNEPLADFDPALTLERYAEMARSDKVKPLAVTEHREVQVGPYAALREVRTGYVDGLGMTFELTYFRSATHFHQVIAGSKARTFAEDRAALELLIDSVRCGSDRSPASAP